ncbi:MAG: HAMP domain-containing histidine kinase [Clostridia bacterium]|nr:HAMP domain-containing histidine kinase [Clostridia bacterium]
MKLDKTRKKMRNLMVIAGIVIVIVSVWTFEFLDYINNYVVHNNYDYDPSYGIGMIVPMGLMVGTVSYIALKSVFNSLMKLVNGLEKVSNGNFDTKIEIKPKEPMAEVYEAFNKMSEELNSVQILRQDFLNNFSHEFKTPITSINGVANLLLEDKVPEDKKKEYLQIISEESKRLANLSNDTILMAKLDNQTIISDKEEYSLDEQIKKCTILLYNEFEKKNIELDIKLDEIKYNGNYEMMQHVWINLINNSIKYSKENGKVEIKLTQDKNNIYFEIRDNGIGMTEETRKRIFEKYYQGDTSHSTEGIGIGLSIVNRIVNLCNGKIEIESEMDKGSIFKIILPIK